MVIVFIYLCNFRSHLIKDVKEKPVESFDDIIHKTSKLLHFNDLNGDIPAVKAIREMLNLSRLVLHRSREIAFCLIFYHVIMFYHVFNVLSLSYLSCLSYFIIICDFINIVVGMADTSCEAECDSVGAGATSEGGIASLPQEYCLFH